MSAALSVEQLVARYGDFTAVAGVDLTVPVGGTLGLVGESGSGKSTVARAIVGLVPAAGGVVRLGEVNVTNARGAKLSALRAGVQMVFQDPYSSLNPRMTVGESLDEAIQAHRPLDRAARATETGRLLDLVGLEATAVGRYPHQFSGGQRQRIAIARALATRAKVIILDEVTSALDVSVQANILNLLRELQRSLGLSLLYISHDLSVVRYLCDSVAVMYLGKIVETAPTESLFAAPQHPYTRALRDAVPQLVVGGRRARSRIVGEIPDPRHPPSGCRFHTRCAIGPLIHPERVVCREWEPFPETTAEGHTVACHFAAAEVAVDPVPVATRR